MRRTTLTILAALTSASAGSLSAQQLRSGIDTAGFDRSVRPQDDFYRYVNGGWLKKTQIPGDASGWGSFSELDDRSKIAVHTLLEDARSAKTAPGSTRRKVADLYATFMDTAQIEKLGLSPIKGELAYIGAITSAAQLPAAFAHFAPVGVTGPVVATVAQDPKESSINIVGISQSGLGLPDRDYYLRQDAKTGALRDGYVAYITRVLELAQQPDAAGSAKRILAFETAIATPQWDRARNRDRNATYNKMTVAELAATMPSYDWKGYLKDAGLGAPTSVVVRQPDYLKALDAIYTSTPASTWREYLTFKLLDTYANGLPAAFEQARFAFRGKMLSGQQDMAVRWKRAVDGVESMYGEPLGALYVEKYFKPAAKQRMDAMVKNLRNAYGVGIDSLEWMSPETKKQAKEKLSRFTVKIGYPDVPRDYSMLEIKRGDLVGNAMRARAFQYKDMVSRLGKPVDRSRWGMTPQTVNAYYNASNNEIVFPAAILQPPFFDVTADDAVNYGGIGAVIGHEIGHGFDDQGRKSDGMGNLRDWWSAADAQAFEARTTKLGAQYDAINPIDDIHINSKLTMGENIGDVSGLAQAYRAYHISLKGKDAPVIDGLTGDQRFFMGFAQIWRAKFRDESLRQQLLTNPHSPDMYRGFVPFVNNDAFMRAFNVKPGDKMYRAPEDRVKIW